MVGIHALQIEKICKVIFLKIAKLISSNQVSHVRDKIDVHL